MAESLNHKSINTGHQDKQRIFTGDIHNILHSEALRRAATLTTIAGLAIGAVAGIKAFNERSIPEETSSSTAVETARNISTQDILAEITNGPEGIYGTYTIPQDHITGVVLEDSVKDYAALHDIQLTEGQTSANFTSAKEIDERVKELSNGSVQPNTKIDVWSDPETGHVLSALHEADEDK